VQVDIWNQQQKRWAKFIKQLDWVSGENNIYRKWPAEFNYTQEAPRGHLPLTNALRGTQVCVRGLEGWDEDVCLVRGLCWWVVNEHYCWVIAVLIDIREGYT